MRSTEKCSVFSVQCSGGSAGGTATVPLPPSALQLSAFIPQPSAAPSSLRRPFTLIELLAAISIIAVLAALIVGAASMASRKAATSKTVSMLKQMEIALDMMYQDRGYYPQQAAPAELNWSVANFTSTTGKVYLDNYDPARFRDAWNRQFWYQCPGTMNPEKYDLWSLGPDGAHGKAGVNDNGAGATDDPGDAQCTAADMSDDIANWKRNE